MGEAGATPGSEGVVLHGAVLPRGKAGHRWGYFVVTRLAFGVCVVRTGEGGQWGQECFLHTGVCETVPCNGRFSHIPCNF